MVGRTRLMITHFPQGCRDKLPNFIVYSPCPSSDDPVRTHASSRPPPAPGRAVTTYTPSEDPAEDREKSLLEQIHGVADDPEVTSKPDGEPARSARGRTAPHLWAAARSVGAKAVTLPIAAIATLVSARAVVDSLGVSGYALFTLAATLPAILPVGDFGAGAAIVEAVARSRDGDQGLLRRAITSGARTLMCAAGLVAALGIVPACFGTWTPLLGRAAMPGTEASVAVAFTLFGCCLPLNLGRSILIALSRTHLAVLVQGVGSVFALILFLGAAAARASVVTFVASGFLAQCLVGIVCLWWAGRILRLPLLSIVVGSVRSQQAGMRIRHLAVPMAVINAGSACAYSTDRLVLSHLSDPATVAVYSSGAQLFAPAVGLIGVAGLPLWALFARQRETLDQPSRRDLVRLTAYFAAGGLIIGMGLILLGPGVSSWMMHDQIRASVDLMTAFATLLFVQAAYYPVGTWLTDAAGLRFQAIRVGVMAAVNLALSVPLALLVGAPGPVIGSVIAFTVIVLVPGLRRSLPRSDLPPTR